MDIGADKLPGSRLPRDQYKKYFEPNERVKLARQVYCVAFACLARADNCANVFCFCSHA